MTGTLCAIGHARVNTREIDARTLADLTPKAWTGDELVGR